MIEYVIAGAAGGVVALFLLKGVIEKEIEKMIGEILENTKESIPNINSEIKLFPDEKEVDINELGKSDTSIGYSQPEPNKSPKKKQDRV